MNIREYDVSKDLQGLYRCVIAIQEFERSLIPGMPSGQAICVDYVDALHSKCIKYSGKIFIAEDEDHGLIGYISIYACMTSEEIDDGPEEFAYIGDLVVLEQFRGNGYGPQLMKAAEQYARSTGAKILRLGVLAANKTAVSLYRKQGFKDLAIELSKDL